MAGVSIGQALKESRTFASARPCNSLTHELMYCHQIHSVNGVSRNSISLGPFRKFAHARCERDMCRGSVLIVLADENDRSVLDGGQVDTFVERPNISRPVAEKTNSHPARVRQPKS